MIKKIILVGVLGITFGATNLLDAEKAITEYNQTKQSINIVFEKSDKVISELAKLVGELQKEIEELKNNIEEKNKLSE